MRNFSDLLDAYKAAKGAKSDYQLATLLGKSRQYVSEMRKTGNASDPFCLDIANVLGIDAGEVMIARNAAKETGPVGDAWRKMLERVAVLCLFLLALNPLESRGFDLHKVTQVLDSSSKDYRKFRIMQLLQALARILNRIFPVTPLTSTTA